MTTLVNYGLATSAIGFCASSHSVGAVHLALGSVPVLVLVYMRYTPSAPSPPALVLRLSGLLHTWDTLHRVPLPQCNGELGCTPRTDMLWLAPVNWSTHKLCGGLGTSPTCVCVPMHTC